jgi:hypothetical protein
MQWRSLIFILIFLIQIHAYDNLNKLDFHQDFQFPIESIKSTRELSADSGQCDSELLLLEQALVNNEPWAVRFVDTWAKVNAGYLSGNTLNFGDFDSCVKFQHEQDTGKVLQGQYCLIRLTALQNSTLDNGRDDLSLKHV